jgi:hypothetical protein
MSVLPREVVIYMQIKPDDICARCNVQTTLSIALELDQETMTVLRLL